jgi:hydrogenase-4 transcriptional activator
MAHTESRDSLLPRAWREVSRHLDIAESTALIAGLLNEYLPLREVLVREIDAPRRRVSSIAAGLSHHGLPVSSDSVDLDPEPFRRLLAWCRKDEPAIWRRQDKNAPTSMVSPASHAWTVLIPSSAPGDLFLVGPLLQSKEVLGALVLCCRGSVDSGASRVIKDLLEPFTVALLNEHRLRELAKLREVAEADKQTLLHRLGRDQMEMPIIGSQSGLRLVMDRVKLVAGADVPVLILGETGAGKEVISRAIHNGSPRAGGPFIRVNCGAIPPELVDSHLFGHEPGSFTGATDQRKGWFERASGGTLFLDEIGELPLPAQVRLLRVLQDGHIERVGGQEPIHVDVRLVAATHRDLAVMVREGRFREDLWYRIAVFPILLPPLRERLADIPPLAQHFAQRAAVRFGLPLQLPTPQDMTLLANYSWPGNVRELAAVIDRAALLGNGSGLQVAQALGVAGSIASVVPQLPITSAANSVLNPAGAAADTSFAPLQQAMRVHIEQALAQTHGKIEGRGGAAALLKINPHTLRARMRKLGIDWANFRTQ